MFVNKISQTITPAQKTSITASVNSILAILTFLFNLTPEDRKKILKMGDKSVSYVDEVLSAMQANPTVVPSTFDVAEFAKDVKLYSDLTDVLNAIRPLTEGIDDTMVLLGNEMMQQANDGYGILKQGAKGNATLSTTVKDIGERFKRASLVKATAFTLAADGHAVVNGTQPGRFLECIQGGPVTFYKEGPVGKSRTASVGNPVKIPSGWTTVYAKNNDSANPTVILVPQK